MSVLLLKDHYKTLGIAVNATQKEIKQSFRRLALIYHPDKHPDNKMAHAQFLRLQEAYELLMDERCRKLYDHERWLSGNFKRVPQVFTPEALILDLEQLQRHLAEIDRQGMDLHLLSDYLQYQLSEEKIGILQMTAAPESIMRIQQLCLHAGGFLPLAAYKQLITRLQLLCIGLPENRGVLYREQQQVTRRLSRQRKLPWILLLLTLLLCLAMYLYGHA